MTRSRKFRSTVTALFLISLILGACAVKTQSSRFYTLRPMETIERAKNPDRVMSMNSLAIGPIEIPDYLDRNQIVTKTTANELKRADFDKWAGSLKTDISRVIAENLAILLASNKVYSYPWDSSLIPDYQVKIYFTRLDGTLGGEVYLNAHWSVIAKKETLLKNTAVVRVQSSGTGYAELVAATSRALERLSRKLVNDFVHLPQH